jgi:hypothetical protein
MTSTLYKNIRTLMITQNECQQKREKKSKGKFTLRHRISLLKEEIIKLQRCPIYSNILLCHICIKMDLAILRHNNCLRSLRHCQNLPLPVEQI